MEKNYQSKFTKSKKASVATSDVLSQACRVIAPSIFPDATWNEAEVIGAMIWLWSKHPDYKNAAINSALENLIPIIRSKNFALIITQQRPIGYINWAYLNHEEEIQYLNQSKDYLNFVNCMQPEQDKNLWILSFFCPFGLHDALLTKSICKKVLHNHLCYFGYHKSKQQTVVKNIQC